MRFLGGPTRALLAALLLLPACPVFAVKSERLARVAPASGKPSYQEVASGRAIVRFKPGISTATAAGALSAAGFSIAESFERFNWSAIRLPEGMGVAAALARLNSLPEVETAQPDHVFRVRRTSNDTYLSRQYALAQVQVFGAWEYETGASSRVTVAVLDTGIDGSHPELSGKLVGTSRYFNPNTGTASDDQPPTPACNHATRAAGVAAAASDNGTGVAGMSWGGKLLSLKVFADADCDDDCSDAGSSVCGTLESTIADAIDDVIAKHDTPAYGKVIVNMSLGQSGVSCSPALQTAVNAAAAAGVMMFAASGNLGATVVDSPANCSNVHPVGATDLQDNLATFSTKGSDMQARGLTAPGVDVYTTDINGGYASATGTSFASPMAAGLAALLWSAKPARSAAQIFDLMKNSADDLGTPGPDWSFGYGRINALKAMRLAQTGSKNFAGTNKAVAYPNPFRPRTQRLVSFSVPEDMTAPGVEVKVYTSEGELVRTLEALAWDGRNEAGAEVASGIYLFRVKNDKDAAVGKLALIR